MSKEELAGKLERMMFMYSTLNPDRRKELKPLIEEVAQRYKDLTGHPYVFIWGSKDNQLHLRFEDRLRHQQDEIDKAGDGAYG